MREPLKVGERVAVYDNGTRQVGVIGLVGVKGNVRIDKVKSQACESWTFGWFHPKQLRRLKPPRKAREFIGEWVEQTQTDVFASNFGKRYLAFIPISSTGIATGPMILKHSLPKKAKP